MLKHIQIYVQNTFSIALLSRTGMSIQSSVISYIADHLLILPGPLLLFLSEAPAAVIHLLTGRVGAQECVQVLGTHQPGRRHLQLKAVWQVPQSAHAVFHNLKRQKVTEGCSVRKHHSSSRWQPCTTLHKENNYTFPPYSSRGHSIHFWPFKEWHRKYATTPFYYATKPPASKLLSSRVWPLLKYLARMSQTYFKYDHQSKALVYMKTESFLICQLGSKT